MENNSSRVLAYGLAQQVSEEDLQAVSGGANTYTYHGTDYYTNKRTGGDKEHDEIWD